MIGEAYGLTTPSNPNIKVWRYMDLSKFISLIVNKSLYFARSDNLGDPFEGSTTHMNSHIYELIIEARKEGHDIYPELDDDGIRNLYSEMDQFAKKTIKETYVSCWHMNETESAAMWRLYSQANEAICIQSTFGKLSKVLPSWVSAGEIHYIDYEREYIPVDHVLARLVRKRKSFEHERELRAIAWGMIAPELGGDKIKELANEFGLSIEVELSELIETVYISPTSAGWFLELVSKVVSDYGYTFPVRKSNLNAEPLF
jgi:hypothetical protein